MSRKALEDNLLELIKAARQATWWSVRAYELAASLAEQALNHDEVSKGYAADMAVVVAEANRARQSAAKVADAAENAMRRLNKNFDTAFLMEELAVALARAFPSRKVN